jgi:aldehyde:ferredoxin oxidoreductase
MIRPYVTNTQFIYSNRDVYIAIAYAYAVNYYIVHLLYSMSAGCAVFFPAIKLVFQFFPLVGTTVYGRRLYKVSLAPSIGTTKHDAS